MAALPANALEVLEKRWGFDGKVYPERFNVLSLRVANRDARPFDGVFTLEDYRGLEGAVGAPYVQGVYLAPGTQRWVQLQVYVTRAGGEWRLRWGPRQAGGLDIDQPPIGPPARVLLVDPESPIALNGALRTFPEDLFPSTVSATDSLGEVVLDHVPRWEGPRREAFLDWVRRGGRVHLLHGADGSHPVFEDALSVLNGSEERMRVGAGWVIRHQMGRASCSDAKLSEAGFPEPAFKGDSAVLVYDFDSELLGTLASLTRPQIAWTLIYLLTLLYTAAIGPLHYYWSRRAPYLRSIAVLVLLIGGFSALYAFVGRRGTGESTQMNGVAVARSLGGGRHDVTQWVSAFVTSGDDYRFSHASASNLYSTAGERNRVKGSVTNGRDGHLEVDMPLYSSRPFVHRAVLQGDRTEMEVARMESGADGRLTALELVPGQGFPAGAVKIWVRHGEKVFRGELKSADLLARVGQGDWAPAPEPPDDGLPVNGDRFYELKKSGDRWVLGAQGVAAAAFLDASPLGRLGQVGTYPSYYRSRNQERTEAEKQAWMESLGQALIVQATDDVDGLPGRLQRPPLSSGELQVFIFAPMPEGFRVKDPRFAAGRGWVLYRQDLFFPQAPLP